MTVLAEYQRISTEFHQHHDINRYTADFNAIADSAGITPADLNATIADWVALGQPAMDQDVGALGLDGGV